MKKQNGIKNENILFIVSSGSFLTYHINMPGRVLKIALRFFSVLTILCDYGLASETCSGVSASPWSRTEWLLGRA